MALSWLAKPVLCFPNFEFPAMLKNFFLVAWRNLLRNKVYSFINIAGLGLGLACALLIILFVADENSYDRFHKDAGQYLPGG